MNGVHDTAATQAVIFTHTLPIYTSREHSQSVYIVVGQTDIGPQLYTGLAQQSVKQSVMNGIHDTAATQAVIFTHTLPIYTAREHSQSVYTVVRQTDRHRAVAIYRASAAECQAVSNEWRT